MNEQQNELMDVLENLPYIQLEEIAPHIIDYLKHNLGDGVIENLMK